MIALAFLFLGLWLFGMAAFLAGLQKTIEASTSRIVAAILGVEEDEQ